MRNSISFPHVLLLERWNAHRLVFEFSFVFFVFSFFFLDVSVDDELII